MDAAKFETLVEYRSDGKAKATEEELKQACLIYMGAEGVDEEALQKACKAALEEALDNKALCLAVCGGTTAAGKALQAFVLEYGNAEEAKPVSSALSRLMDEDLADDDEDDGDARGSDDDEEEDEEDEDGGKAKKQKKAGKAAPLEPVMRGLLKAKDGKLVWAGKWALSKEKYDAGTKSKFKYVYAGPKPVSTKAPPSGKFPGFFMLDNGDGTKPTRVEEKATTLTFGSPEGESGWIKVSGEGSNSFGKFTITGMYAPESGKLSVVKKYAPQDDLFEGGGDDSDDGDSAIDDDDPADVAAELADLQADAQEDIETLLKRKRAMDQAEQAAKKKKG